MDELILQALDEVVKQIKKLRKDTDTLRVDTDALRSRLITLEQKGTSPDWVPIVHQIRQHIKTLERRIIKLEERPVCPPNESQRYWVIAPFHSKPADLFLRIWEFDLTNSIISIGWSELGDISGDTEQGLRAAVDRTYPDKPAGARVAYFNMLWKFFHSISVGDTIIARRGTQRIVGVGIVRRAAYYDPTRNPGAVHDSNPAYPNHLDVHWREPSQSKVFSQAVFGLLTLYQIPKSRFLELVES